MSTDIVQLRTDPKLLTDLEISDKVIPTLDRTVTSYGHEMFKQMFDTILIHKEDYINQQNNIKNILYDTKNKNVIRKTLHKIKKIEPDVEWFFSEDDKDYSDMCFQSEYFNISGLISTKNFLKTYSQGITLVIYLIIYMVFRYKGMNVDLKTYFKGIYE